MHYVDAPYTWRGQGTYEDAPCGYCMAPCMVPVMPKREHWWQTFAPAPPPSCSTECRLRNNQWQSWIDRTRIQIFTGTISEPPDLSSLPFAKRAMEAIAARALSLVDR